MQQAHDMCEWSLVKIIASLCSQRNTQTAEPFPCHLHTDMHKDFYNDFGMRVICAALYAYSRIDMNVPEVDMKDPKGDTSVMHAHTNLYHI